MDIVGILAAWLAAIAAWASVLTLQLSKKANLALYVQREPNTIQINFNVVNVGELDANKLNMKVTAVTRFLDKEKNGYYFKIIPTKSSSMYGAIHPKEIITLSFDFQNDEYVQLQNRPESHIQVEYSYEDSPFPFYRRSYVVRQLLSNKILHNLDGNPYFMRMSQNEIAKVNKERLDDELTAIDLEKGYFNQT
jgi:hypothetical protein